MSNSVHKIYVSTLVKQKIGKTEIRTPLKIVSVPTKIVFKIESKDDKPLPEKTVEYGIVRPQLNKSYTSFRRTTIGKNQMKLILNFEYKPPTAGYNTQYLKFIKEGIDEESVHRGSGTFDETIELYDYDNMHHMHREWGWTKEFRIYSIYEIVILIGIIISAIAGLLSLITFFHK